MDRCGDWITSGRGIVVVYNWPTGDGALYALLVTLWLAA